MKWKRKLKGIPEYMKPKGPYIDLNALWKDGYSLKQYLEMKEIPQKYVVRELGDLP